tara:strand:- start:1356 stop:2219 length:864 start_codon:yes stop_codon:yes gene_type:complete
MKTINSLSGGKTSSYLAVHYPADYNIFSLVCIDDKKCVPLDKKIVQSINDKFEKYGYIKKYGEFIATAEDDKTLKVMFDLEQMLGKEIVWVRGDSFETIIKKKGNVVPNMARRFCTSEMKMRPIGEFVYHNIMDKKDLQPVFSNVGFRYDEKERAKTTMQEREIKTKLVIGKRKTQQKWKEIFWGVSNYPLINNHISHPTIYKYWENKNLIFPEDSNCVGCFWKDVQQLRKNYDTNNAKMEWFNNAEKKSNYNWKSEINYDQIKKVGKQLGFNYGGGSGCQGGFCTD